MNQHPSKSLVRRWLELIRFSHTVFALPFALLACVWAFVVPLPTMETLTHDSAHATVTVADAKQAGLAGRQLSNGQIALRVLGVLLCMVSARSAAMAFNRLVDARFDAGNPRTAARHLVSGELTRGQAWIFFAVMVLMFFLACTLFLPNWLPLAGALPVLLWICGYSLAKRFTSAVHLWLGVALALSPICAWVAMRGEVLLIAPSDVWPAVGLAAAIAFWVAGFDIIYACQDATFDRQTGLYSLPAQLGVLGALRVAAGSHGLMLVVLAGLPSLFPQLSLGLIYWTGLVIVAGLVIRQHAIIWPREGREWIEELRGGGEELRGGGEDGGGVGGEEGEGVEGEGVGGEGVGGEEVGGVEVGGEEVGGEEVGGEEVGRVEVGRVEVGGVGEMSTSDAERRATLGRINEAFFEVNALLSFCLSIVAAIDAVLR